MLLISVLFTHSFFHASYGMYEYPINRVVYTNWIVCSPRSAITKTFLFLRHDFWREIRQTVKITSVRQNSAVLPAHPPFRPECRIFKKRHCNNRTRRGWTNSISRARISPVFDFKYQRALFAIFCFFDETRILSMSEHVFIFRKLCMRKVFESIRTSIRN